MIFIYYFLFLLYVRRMGRGKVVYSAGSRVLLRAGHVQDLDNILYRGLMKIGLKKKNIRKLITDLGTGVPTCWYWYGIQPNCMA